MQTKRTNLPGQAAFTLAETLVSILIMGLVFAGALLGYTRATQRAEWSGFSLAAQALCARQMEQWSAVAWNTQVIPWVDDTTNLPNPVANILDIPISGTNVVWATSTATTNIFTLPGPCYVKMITVNTTWPWRGKTFTNTLVNYRAPDS